MNTAPTMNAAASNISTMRITSFVWGDRSGVIPAAVVPTLSGGREVIRAWYAPKCRVSVTKRTSFASFKVLVNKPLGVWQDYCVDTLQRRTVSVR